MKQKLVVGMFMVPEEDAGDLAKNLMEFGQGNSIGMDWFDVKISASIDPDTIAWGDRI